MENVPEGGERCFVCYRLRLEKAAQYAAEHGFDYFCSTLSISPMKNAAKLNEIGEELSEIYPVKLLPSDFKKKGGYLRSFPGIRAVPPELLRLRVFKAGSRAPRIREDKSRKFPELMQLLRPLSGFIGRGAEYPPPFTSWKGGIFMKKLISLLIALTLGTLLCIPGFAADDNVLPCRDWDTTSAISPEYANFVTADTSIPWSTNIRENTLMVVTDGAVLRIKKDFTVNGVLIVHSGSKVVVQDGGSLIIGKAGIIATSGSIVVNKGGKLRNYGCLQTGGKVTVKGILKTYSSGAFKYSSAPRITSSGKILGKRSAIKGAPEYYFEDLHSLRGEMLHVRLEETGEEMDTRCTSTITQPAAAVLYKLDRTIRSATYPTSDSELGRLMGKRYITVRTSVYRPVIGSQTDRWYEDMFHPDADAPVLD